MKQTLLLTALFALVATFIVPAAAEAQRRRSRRAAEVVAWSQDGSIVIFAEPQPRSRRNVDLVARRVPNGNAIARVPVFPGQCARRIEGRVAIAHACALAEIRPRLASRLRRMRFHIAANERGRIVNISLRADGSIVEHELPGLGLVLRGRLEEEQEDRAFAVLEVTHISRDSGGRVIDRRPVRPRSRRRWTLLKAGDNHFIVVGRGVLRRIGRRPRRPAREPSEGRPQSTIARTRPASG